MGVCLRSAMAKVAKVTRADDPGGGLASGYRAGGGSGQAMPQRPGGLSTRGDFHYITFISLPHKLVL